MILAQNFMIGTIIILMGFGLGLLAVCIPRPRRRFRLEQRKRSQRHEAAGTYRRQSKYAERG